MENSKSNYIGKFIEGMNSTNEETEKLEMGNEKVEGEIEERINKYKQRFKKLEQQLQSEILIKYINENQELNKIVYQVYSILKKVKYRK